MFFNVQICSDTKIQIFQFNCGKFKFKIKKRNLKIKVSDRSTK